MARSVCGSRRDRRYGTEKTASRCLCHRCLHRCRRDSVIRLNDSVERHRHAEEQQQLVEDIIMGDMDEKYDEAQGDPMTEQEMYDLYDLPRMDRFSRQGMIRICYWNV